MRLSIKGVGIGKSVPTILRYDGERKLVAKPLISHCQEKPLVRLRCPYRKPTQVGEERILRLARELLLRNSAKWSRNFGRRDAYESRPQ